MNKEQRALERRMFRDLTKSYKEIEQELTEHLSRMPLDGSPAQVLSSTRMTNLLNLVREQMQGYANNSLTPIVTNAMEQTSFLAEGDVIRLLTKAYGDVVPVVTLPAGAINNAAMFANYGPLRQLLDTFGETAAAKARRDLLTGLALGQHPTKLAKTLQKSLGISYKRALLIARTETLRAHREASRQAYRRNKHLVKGWVWHAAASDRTCAACWAMHGSVHSLDEKMSAHPACRCSMVPLTKTWRELGYNFDEVTQPVPQGEDLFAQQSESTQRKVLGKHYDRYKRGEVKLSDFVATRQSKWGNTIVKKVPR